MGEDGQVTEGNSASQQSRVRGCGLKYASFGSVYMEKSCAG